MIYQLVTLVYYYTIRYTWSNQRFCKNILVARIGDPTVSHPNPPVPICPNHVATVNAGSPNVYVAGIKVGRIGDSADAGMIDAKNNTNVYANVSKSI